MPSTSVVTLAFGDEPWLQAAVTSALETGPADLEVIVVDNGTTLPLEAIAALDDRIRIVGTGENLGFAGGVDLGVGSSTGEVVVLLNSDAEFLDDTLPRLAELAAHPNAGIVGATIVMGADHNVVNSRGNPLHVLGLSWAGGIDTSASDVPAEQEVASASGACLALSRELWDTLHGFDPLYFAYFEDMDLCWRCHQLGLPVRVHGDLKVAHHYEFSRNPLKMYLLERNRLLFVMTTYQARTLWALALPLAALEVALLGVAMAQGWGAEKRRGWSWLLHNRRAVRKLRRRVQASRKVADVELFDLMTDTFDTTQLPIPGYANPLQAILRGYWRLARKALVSVHVRPQSTQKADLSNPDREDPLP